MVLEVLFIAPPPLPHGPSQPEGLQNGVALRAGTRGVHGSLFRPSIEPLAAHGCEKPYLIALLASPAVHHND